MENWLLGPAATIFLLPGWKLSLEARCERRPQVPWDTHGDSGGQKERRTQLRTALGSGSFMNQTQHQTLDRMFP